MPKEKIGSDILGPGERPSIRLTKAQLKKLEEARKQTEKGKRKKTADEEDEEILPKLGIPGELPHEPKLGEAGYDKVEEEVARAKKKKKTGLMH